MEPTTAPELESWVNYKELLQNSFTKIIKAAVTNDIGCILPTKSSQYNIEQTEDGYWRLRYQTKEYIKNEDGTDRARNYKRKRKDGSYDDATRKDKVKASIFVHHLALLQDGRSLKIESEHHHTISHLCGVSTCCNSRHLLLEPHKINLSRIYCCSEICVHTTKCIRPAVHIQAKVKAIEAKFYECK